MWDAQSRKKKEISTFASAGIRDPFAKYNAIVLFVGLNFNPSCLAILSLMMVVTDPVSINPSTYLRLTLTRT